MNYKVKALFAVGKRRSFKHGEVVSGSEFGNAAAMVVSGFLTQVDEDPTPEPVKEPAEEPRIAETEQGTDRIAPSAPTPAAAPEATPAPPAIVNDGPDADFQIKKGKSASRK